MQRDAQRGWRHGVGRILPVLAVALLALGPAHSKDKKKKHQDDDTQAAAPAPDAPVRPADAPRPDSPAHEQPRAVPAVSLDRVISQVERRYKARVVRADKIQRGGKLVYELRLLSEEGRVWTVRVDAETGNEV